MDDTQIHQRIEQLVAEEHEVSGNANRWLR